MLLRGFPADDLFGPIVFRVAVRHAVRVSDIKNGELAPLIVHGGDSLPLAVHNRMLTLYHPADLAQDRSEFCPWIQSRRRLMFRFPFRDFCAVCFGTHVPSFFDRVPTCPECFRFIPFDVWDDQVRSFCVWNVFSHHPNLLGMSYLLLLFDCKDVVADAFEISSFATLRPSAADPHENAKRRFGVDLSAMAPFVPACCCITPCFLADSCLPVHLVPAEPP